jgi:hypothetical protein
LICRGDINLPDDIYPWPPVVDRIAREANILSKQTKIHKDESCIDILFPSNQSTSNDDGRTETKKKEIRKKKVVAVCP